MRVVLLLLLLSSLSLAQAPVGTSNASPFAVKGSRESKTDWLVLQETNSLFLYRVHNRGSEPVQIMTAKESKKASGKFIVEVRPDETVDLLLKPDRYVLRCPLGGGATGWYALMKILPVPEKKEE